MKILATFLTTFMLTYASFAQSPFTGTPGACVGSTSGLSDPNPAGTWSSSDNTIATVDPVMGIVTGVAPGAAIITYTYEGLFDTGTFVVTAVPAGITGASTVCAGQNITLYDVTPGGNWTSSDNGLALVDPVSGIVTGEFEGSPTIYYNVGAGCSAATVITVNPLPTVDAVTSQTVCSGSNTAEIDFTSSLSGTTYTWTNSDVSIGLGPTDVVNIASFTAIDTSISMPNTATITVTPFANGCTGLSTNFTITINPVPSVNPISNQALCTGTNTTEVDFSGSPVPGTVYSWTNSDVTIGLESADVVNILSFTATDLSTTTPDVATITVTPIAGGCSGTPQLFTFTANPIPTIDPIADMTYCNGDYTSRIDFTGSVAGTTYNWTNSNITIGLGGTGTGTIWPFTISNTESVPVTATITIIPSANGCTGTGESFNININPTPNVAPVSGQTVCSETATAEVDFSGLVSGTTFSWTNNNTSINLGPGLNGNIPSFTAYNAGLTAATANITVVPSANGCNGAPIYFSYFVNPLPNVLPVPDQTLCNGSSTLPISFGSGVSSSTFAWTNSNTDIGLGLSGNGDIASFAVNNSGTSPETAMVTVTPSANGCNGSPLTFAINVNPIPNVIAPLSQTVCAGASSTDAVFTGDVAGTSYPWTNDNPTIGLGASSTGNITSFIATNSGVVPVTGNITVTPVANGCTGASQNFSFTVNPMPVVGAITDQTLCSGAATTPVSFSGPVSGTLFSWTNNNLSTGLAAGGTGDIASFTGSNTDHIMETSTILITPSANGCTGATQSFRINVNPVPNVNAITDQMMCNGVYSNPVNFSGAVTGTQFTWVNSNTTIGLGSAGTGNISSFIGQNPGTALEYATITATPQAAGCVGATQNFSIIVKPTPNVALPGNQTVCNATAVVPVNFTGSVSGTTYTWTNNKPSIGLGATGTGDIASFTASNTTTLPVTATIIVTPTAASCQGGSEMFSILVNPTPALTAPTSQTLCNGVMTVPVHFTGTVGETVFAWSNSNTGIGLSSSGEGNIASFAAMNSSDAPINSNIVVTPYAYGCAGTAENFSITINPTPNVLPISGQTVCNSAPTAAINFSGSVVATGYSWTNSNTSIGLDGSGTGNIPSFPAMNSGTAILNSTISVLPSSHGCNGSPVSFTIKVNPTPTVTIPTSFTICNGTSTGALSFSGTVAGTVYSWTNNNTSIGLPASGTGNITSFTGTNISSAPETSVVMVSPAANGCTGTSHSFDINVNPIPAVAAIPGQALCNGTSSMAVGFSGPVAGTAFNWTNSNSRIGLATAGSGNIHSFTAVNGTTAPTTATVVVIPTANGCTGPEQSFAITVNPTPAVTTPANETLCNGGTTVPVAFAGTVSGTTYSWTNSNPGIGLANAGTGNISAFEALNSGSSALNAVISVTPSANGCSGAAHNFSILVNPTPNIASIGSQTICNGTATTAVHFNGAVTGTTYSWTNNNTSIGLASAGSGNIASFTATNIGISPATSVITVSPSANGCTGASENFTVTVNPTPGMSLPSSQTLCNNSTTLPVDFTGTISGTTFGWSNNNYHTGLSTAGVGNIAAFTAANSTSIPEVSTVTIIPSLMGCNGASVSFEITVNPTPVLVAIPDQTYCNNTLTAETDFSSSVIGATYSWVNNNPAVGLAAIGSGNVTPFLAMNGGSSTLPATLTITPSANGCAGTPQSFNIHVNPTPNVAAVANQDVCNGASTDPVSFSGPVTGTIFNWENSNSSIGIGATGTGNIASFAASNTGNVPEEAIVTVTPTANGCAGAPVTFNINVKPTPSVVAVTNQIVCNGAATTAEHFSSPVSGTTFSWTNTNYGIGLAGSGLGDIASFPAFNASATPATAIVTVTPAADGCTGTPASFHFTIDPTADVSAVTSQAICNGSNVSGVHFNGSVPGTIYSWTNDNSSIGLDGNGNGDIAAFAGVNMSNVPQAGNITVTPSYDHCPGNARTFMITVNPTPNLEIPDNQTFTGGYNTTEVDFTDYVMGSTYTWTNSNPSIGLPASGTGDIPSFLATNNSTESISGVITITPSAYGCPGASQSFSITIISSTGVNAVAGGGRVELKMYPNPVDQVLNVALSGDVENNTELRIFDMAGKQVFSDIMAGNKATIHVEHLAPGYYILGYYSNGSLTGNAKFIKN